MLKVKSRFRPKVLALWAEKRIDTQQKRDAPPLFPLKFRKSSS